MDIAIQLWEDKYDQTWYAVYIDGKKVHEAGPVTAPVKDWRFEIEDNRKRA